jgi:AcrR family transcriptional regulator
MPRTRLTQEARKAKTRAALVDAATRLFARRGLEATSLDEVALAAGYTKGAIYANFPNKRALIDAVVERHVVQLDPDPLLRADLPFGERLALMGRTVAQLIASLPKEMVLLDLEYSLAVLRNPRNRTRVVTARDEEFAKVPAQLDALNLAQGVESPFTTPELFFVMAMLVRALARALAEQPGALDAAGIERLFRLLSGEELAQPARKGSRARSARRPVRDQAPQISRANRK